MLLPTLVRSTVIVALYRLSRTSTVQSRVYPSPATPLPVAVSDMIGTGRSIDGIVIKECYSNIY